MPNQIPTAQVRLENTEIRGACSPTDYLITIVPGVTLVGGGADIDIASHVNHAEVVGYWFLKTATTTFNGTTNVLTTAKALPSDTGVVDIAIMYRANKAQ